VTLELFMTRKGKLTLALQEEAEQSIIFGSADYHVEIINA